MPSFDYIVPISYVSEDNNTYINKATIMVKDCDAFNNLNAECSGYNFNRCPNDGFYCQPYIVGDKLYFQIPLIYGKYFYIDIFLVNTITGQEYFLNTEVLRQNGYGVNRAILYNFCVDTNTSIFDGKECFYFKFKLYKCQLNTEAYNTFDFCVQEKINAGFNELNAIAKCYSENCLDFDFITSEPYCKIKCDEPTLLIEGVYTGYDCNGFWHGNVGGQQSIYKSQYRIPAGLESDGFEFEETFNGTNKIKSIQKERFIFFTYKVPYYVATQIANCFNSSAFYVDNQKYTGTVKLDKNFDSGSEWLIRENIFKVCDEISFSCE